MTMKQIGGVWLPGEERHLVEWMQQRNQVVDGKLTYQYHKLESALRRVTNWECAIDIGAHVGLWSMHLAKHFRTLLAFEPMELHRACFARNMPEGWNGTLFACALGDRQGSATMLHGEASSGDTRVGKTYSAEQAPAGAVLMETLDGLVPSSTQVGFIKIDVEGFEEHVVRGGRALIQRQGPVICVEQKAHVLERNYGSKVPGAVHLLQSWGYQIAQELSGDFIMTAGARH